MPADRILLIVAHQDDEVIAAGAQFPDWAERLRIVQVTDGAPLDVPDREAYARTREAESYAAAALAGIRKDQFRRLGFTDKETIHHLPELIRAVQTVIDEEQPAIIYTHPYEGGHPDHDATAYAVHQVATCPLWEFACYHAGRNGIETGCFLGDDQGAIHHLTDQQKHLKQEMFRAFPTQQEILSIFQLDDERFRPSPNYDFTQPPHPLPLNYELWPWNITYEHFQTAVQLTTDH